jgi:hypothetical protein
METICTCGKWVIEIEPMIWAHSDDMLVCVPDADLPVTYSTAGPASGALRVMVNDSDDGAAHGLLGPHIRLG